MPWPIFHAYSAVPQQNAEPDLYGFILQSNSPQEDLSANQTPAQREATYSNFKVFSVD